MLRRCGLMSNDFDHLLLLCWWSLQDEYDDDGDLRPQYRRLSLHSAAASSRALLSAVSARILHVTPPSHSPPPAASAAAAALPDTAASTSGAMRPRSSVCAVSETRAAAAAVHHQRRYHSFRSALRPGHRARLSFDSGQTARTQPPHNTST